MNYKVIDTPENNTSRDVVWEVDGKHKGFGYIAKKGSKKIGLIRCPKCSMENYAMAVPSGICYACGFDANK